MAEKKFNQNVHRMEIWINNHHILSILYSVCIDTESIWTEENFPKKDVFAKIRLKCEEYFNNQERLLDSDFHGNGDCHGNPIENSAHQKCKWIHQ